MLGHYLHYHHQSHHLISNHAKCFFPLFFFCLFFFSQIPVGLPQNKYVRLLKSDQVVIEKWIDNKLGAVAMKGQKDNLTTNRCESSHLTVLRGSPKCRNRFRNFPGRAMSAVHSMSLGVTDSVLLANAHLGADNIYDSPASFTRGKLRQREKYHKQRKRSYAFKVSEYAASARARRERYAEPETSNTGYATGVQNPVVRHEHLSSNSEHAGPSTSGHV